MSRHSKWSNIKHTKARKNIKRGKIFTKLIRAIIIATRLSGEAIASNPRLRIAVNRAFAANMQNTISRAIKYGIRGGKSNNLIEVLV